MTPRGPKESGSRAEPRPRPLPLKWLVVAVAVGAVAVTVGVILGGAAGSSVESGFAPPDSTSPRTPARSDAPPGYVRVGGGQGRFSIAHPADWTRLDSADPGVDLLVTKARTASLLARSFPLRFRVDRTNLPAAEGITDEIVRSGRRVRLLAQSRRIELGGLPGYFYFYTFRDRKTGRRGTHSHYFLFQGDTMITLVLQALPESEFRRFATVFDRIAASFRAGRP